MKFYKLRVDLDTTPLDKVSSLLKQYSPCYMYCVEDIDGDNPHCHWYLELEKLSQTLRPKLRELGLSGNKSYSLKELDERYPIEYLAYIIKQKRWHQEGIPQDIIDQALAHDELVKSQLKAKKEGRQTQLQKFDKYAQERFSDRLENMSLNCYIRLAVEWFKDTGSLYREFQVKSIAQTLYLKYNPEAVSKLVSLLDKN